MSENVAQSETVKDGVDTHVDDNLNNTNTCLACNQQDNELQESTSDTTIVDPQIPNGGYGWIIVFASFIINLISDGIGFSFGLLYIEFLRYFGESKGKTAWIGSLFFSIPLVCGPIASALVDRYGCRKMTIIGGILASIGFILSSFVHSLEVMFFTFGIISGFGLALSYVSAIVIVAFYFDNKRGFATGLSVCGTGIGTFIFAPLISYLIEEYSWRGAVLILGGIFLNITVCGAVMRDLEWVKRKRHKSLSSSNASSPMQCENPSGSKLFVPDCDRLSNSLFQLPTYMNNSQWMQDETKFSENDDEKVVIKRTRVPSMRLKLKKLLTDEPVTAAATSTLQVSSSYLQNIKLHKQSLTYRGAMLNIHRYHLKASSCPNIYQNADCHIYPTDQKYKLLADLKETILGWFDPFVFQSVPFMVFCISNFLLYIWYDIPYIYMPDNALLIGVSESQASFLISIIGILNTVGTIFLGYAGDKSWMNSSLLYSIITTLSGVVTFVIPLLMSYWAQCVAAGSFGFFISANYALTSVIIVEIISLDHFTNAYGLLLLSQGIANLVGPPIGGFLFDMTGNYMASFYSAGIGIILSGLMILFIVGLHRKSNQDVPDPSCQPVQTIVTGENGHSVLTINGH